MGASATSFKIGGGDPIVIYGIIGLLLLGVLIGILVYVYKNVYVKYRLSRQEWARFYHVCHRRKLTAAEVNFLEQTARKYQLKKPAYLVRFLETFNRYIYREVEESRGEETKKRERFIAFIFNLRKKLGFANFDRLEELTSSREISPGQRIRVTITIAGIDKGFSSKIDEVDEDGLKITCPEHFLDEEPVREGHAVKFSAVHKDDAEYHFSTNVHKIIPGPPSYLWLNHSRSFTRTQRRKYTRIEGQFRFKFFILDKMQRKEFMERRTATVTKETAWQEGLINNLSAGGFVFGCAGLEEGLLLGVVLRLSETTPELKDIVGRIERIINPDAEVPEVVLQFAKIPEKVREHITRYVYQKKTGEAADTQQQKAVKKKTA